jgi:hypothetical protein
MNGAPAMREQNDATLQGGLVLGRASPFDFEARSNDD